MGRIWFIPTRNFKIFSLIEKFWFLIIEIFAVGKFLQKARDFFLNFQLVAASSEVIFLTKMRLLFSFFKAISYFFRTTVHLNTLNLTFFKTGASKSSPFLILGLKTKVIQVRIANCKFWGIHNWNFQNTLLPINLDNCGYHFKVKWLLRVHRMRRHSKL